jgi:hypothetical protein
VIYAFIIENNDALTDLSGSDNIKDIRSSSSFSTCCESLIIADNYNLLNFKGSSKITEIKVTMRR